MAENYFKTGNIHAMFKDYSNEVVRPCEYLITVEQVGFRGKDLSKIIF